MKKQCLVIGLGIFGMSVAKKLSEEGVDVLAIDKDMRLVERASKFVNKAICLNINSLDAFNNLPMDSFDIAVVGIGENVPVSILTCLALKETKIKYIIAKGGDKLHKEVFIKPYGKKACQSNDDKQNSQCNHLPERWEHRHPHKNEIENNRKNNQNQP